VCAIVLVFMIALSPYRDKKVVGVFIAFSCPLQ
jgi:hypothetical protein